MPDSSSPIKYLLVGALLLLVFQALFIKPDSSVGEGVNIERYRLDMLEKDVLTVYISPPVENLSVRCIPLSRSGSFDLSISTKYVDPYIRLRKEVSAVWVQPSASGVYNLTVRFISNKTWEYMLGVYSKDFNFYRKYYGERIRINNFFIELQTPQARISGNWTINIVMKTYSSSPSFSYITLPTPVNSVILVAAVGLIAYVNSFIVLDTYFKSKKEIVSHSRWAIVGIVLLISVYAAYQLYNFMTFTISGGG